MRQRGSYPVHEATKNFDVLMGGQPFVLSFGCRVRKPQFAARCADYVLKLPGKRSRPDIVHGNEIIDAAAKIRSLEYPLAEPLERFFKPFLQGSDVVVNIVRTVDFEQSYAVDGTLDRPITTGVQTPCFEGVELAPFE